MFQKPTFGTGTSGFGSFNAGASSSSPFGGFKPPASTSAFGAPAFGAATAQPATGGGLFGASNTSGGLFGGTPATSAPAFGTTTGGFGGFGANTSAGGGLFGTTQNAGTGLFGNTTNTSAFGAKPAGGFGFGSTTTTGTTGGGLFGGNTASTGLFGQNNATMSGGGLFSNTTGAFGQQQQVNGTAHVKYNPLVGTDTVVKSGTTQTVSIKHHCITCMKEYENKSLEELRLEDYVAGRKGSAAAGSMFGGFQQQAPAENKPLFGGTGAFGQPATTSAPSMFGGGGLGTTGGFGQTSAFSFGGNTQQNTATTGGGLFGASKPTFGATTTPGTGLFGATTTQAPSFGTNTSTFGGFGANTQNQSGGLFGAKPATTGFGAAPAASSGFGAFGSGGGLFGAKPQQTTAPTFGTATPAFGQTGAFGANTSTSGGGLFGTNTSFGKPTTTQPTFGFGAPSTGLGTGLGGTLGANTFGAKPAATPFGGLGATLGQQQPTTQFKTGLESGMGGGLFGNTSSLGGGTTSFNAFNANTSTLANNLSGASVAGNVHEQILTLAARPYGDSPLFKNLLPDSSTTAEDVLKPTNPAAVKAVLDSSNNYRVMSPTVPRIKVQPRPSLSHDKKSLFDGLEESDASLEDKLTLKPSRKRLVLRPKHGPNAMPNDSVEQQQNTNQTNRSVEEPQRDMNGSRSSLDKAPTEPQPRKSDSRRSVDLVDSASEYSVSDKHGSWLSPPVSTPWREKERAIDGEPTPRLYPNLDKELPIQISERRASWLNTKTLRKTPYTDTIENSARDLGLRSEKENSDNNLSVSEEENVQPRDVPPHPTGVKLTRPGYYTIPTLDEMIGYMKPDGTCVVPNLTVGRKNYGNVFYDCEIDVAGLDLDALVHFLNKEVIIYPEDADKPPVGQGLNRRAIVTLDRVWPRDKTEKRLITDPDRLIKMDYEGKLRRVCDKHDTKFIEYRPQTGSWVFRVEHFSKYGLTDSDEEEEMAPDVLKRQIANQSLQRAAPPAPPKPPAVSTSSGLGGLGGLSSMVTDDISGNDSLFAMHQTSLNLLNGAGKAFEMDTTEDNHEPLSFYQENSTSRAYGVKSPTSELARLEHRQSHHVQLMKASLYADVDMEDDISVSTGDQLVPQPTTLSVSLPTRPPSVRDADAEILEHALIPVITDEAKMPPLILTPHTIVLKYHGKVPPFKKTIAGRLNAACIADLSICRARHTRCGFGPGGAISYVTSYDSVLDLPKNADLCDLGRYVQGRAENDWSESVVTRLGIGQADNALQDVLSRHLETLFKYSNFAECQEDMCPKLVVSESPSDRLDILKGHINDAKITCEKYPQRRFGVSSDYCEEVWRLCDALWGADLENNGIPGTDEQSIVERHKRLLEWMTSAVSLATDEELSKPKRAEAEDETDGHIVRVWTLLLGGRILEACKVAKDNGDLNMAVLIAQCAGDSIFQALVARQLSLWRECGADALIAHHRLATLRLLAAQCGREQFLEVDWLRTLHATARYICPQVPSLEQIIRKYESFFVMGETDEQEQIDLSAVSESETGMQYPLPPYIDQYEVNVYNNGHKKRILDVRYELIRARAYNTRPKLRPAAYTPDPLDYTLCFLLGTWFGNPTIESITGLAEQLESCGAWHLAINALAYHPNDAARGHLIRGVLSRHAPSKAGTAELQSRIELVMKLRVPERWLLVAQAYRAKYEHLPGTEATHLVGAGQWNAAHKILLEELLPEAVLADDLKSISPLLEKINEAAKRHEVSGWESGGQALYHYLHVCDEIRSVVSNAEGIGRTGVSSKLEALRPSVAAACRALAALGATPISPRHAAARAEMGARLVQLAIAAGESAHHLAELLKALKLPPDCTAHVQHKITTELAQQADLSIESTTSSPPNTRRRAIAME